jgi:hypothetical protein
MIQGSDRLQQEISYNPQRFRQMIAEHGAVQAVRRLLQGSNASDGFTTLWEHQHLDLSCEAIALLPWYANMFSAEELQTARYRLIEHKFDVDAFLSQMCSSPPSWYDEGLC